jgi:hypothetical protein
MPEENKKDKNGPGIMEEIRFGELNKKEKFQLIQMIWDRDKKIKELTAELKVKSEELERRERQKKEADLKVSPLVYDPNATGIEKIIVILSSASKIMTSSQIKNIFRQWEPLRIMAWRKRLSAVEKYLSRAVKYQKIRKYHLPGGKFFYALPGWFDTEGKLMEKYLVR